MKSPHIIIKLSLLLAFISYSSQMYFGWNKSFPDWLMFIQSIVPYGVYLVCLHLFKVRYSFVAPVLSALCLVYTASLSVFCTKFPFDAIEHIKITLYCTIPVIVSSILLFVFRNDVENKH